MDNLGPLPRCDLGDLVAEHDQSLEYRYVVNEHSKLAEDIGSNKLYFIGKKGFGKSAIIQRLRLSKPRDQIIDLGVQTGLDLLTLDTALTSLPESAQGLLFRSFWRAYFMGRIYATLGKSFSTFSKTEPEKAFEYVRRVVSSGTGPQNPFSVLKSLVNSLSIRVNIKQFEADIGVKVPSQRLTEELAKTEFLHQIQLAGENFRGMIHHRPAYVLIDDLDQDWQNEPIQNAYLAALFDTIERFRRIEFLKFVVSLRLDIFHSLTLQNPDKIVQHVHRLSWPLPVLRQIVEQRITLSLDEPRGRTHRRFDLKRSGNPIEIILADCLPHPRDAIWSIQSILDLAHTQNKAVIDQTLVTVALREASSNRVKWICAEWRYVYPWLPKALSRFRDGPNLYSISKLTQALSGIADGLPQAPVIIQGLMETGVLGLKHKPDGTPLFFFAQDPPPPPYKESCYFEIHPALRSALQSGKWVE